MLAIQLAAMSVAIAARCCHRRILPRTQPLTYPATRRVDQVDDYHGEKVADPYRWLEDDARTSQEVADWIAAQNKVTRDVSRRDSRARGVPPAARRAVELRALLGAVEDGRPVLLLRRTTACRTSRCCTGPTATTPTAAC